MIRFTVERWSFEVVARSFRVNWERPTQSASVRKVQKRTRGEPVNSSSNNVRRFHLWPYGFNRHILYATSRHGEAHRKALNLHES